jgi:hypothetical protein
MNSGILRTGEGQAVWVVGDHYTIKASGEDTGGAFALIEVLVPPQSGPPPHLHRREDRPFATARKNRRHGDEHAARIPFC